ncbi:signal peptidase I [Rubritalea spongiae]|uniref:Signal peptidase I n=1 Tax=Rubritalea spongiae TaxID=430797 RepID=A0ABW5E3R4_9BACT
MFTPKWKKEAKHLYKGSKKFIHYKRDLLEQDRIEEIESRRADLQKAWKSGSKEEAKEAGNQLQACCEQALPRYKAPDALAENVEVLFVAIVIALGLRAYYLQPFRIPTGSMRPSLNGLIGYVEPKENWPSFPVRMLQEALYGRSYYSVTAEQDGDRIVNIKQGQWMHFFSRCYITFESGRVESVPGSESSFLESINFEKIRQDFGAPIGAEALPYVRFPKDYKIAEGYMNSGDLVLVDKFSYHFRAPKAGETFVFDTREIKQIRNQPGYGSHYIKRLIATPGDKVELIGGTPDIDNQNQAIHRDAILHLNGEKMKAPGVLKVESKQDGYSGYISGYRLPQGRPLLMKDKPSSGKSEYWAMGDNSPNSSDSRMWGTVKEFNLVGPAAFTLWPFGSGHWGFID